MNDNDKVKLILEDTIVRLEDGWGQGMYYNHTTNCYCVAGAIWWAAEKRGAVKVIDKVFQAVASQILDHSSYSPEDKVICWNDRVGRTKAEVVELLGNAYAFTCLMDQDDD